MEVEVEAPHWLKSFTTNMTDLSFIMEKEITDSDVRGDQNRLLIPMKVAEARLVPQLTDEERLYIFPPGVLLPDGRLVRKRHGLPSEGQEGESAAAGAQPAAPVGAQPAAPGVPVEAYQRSGWKFHTHLKYWGSTGAVVLNGGEYRYLRSWNNALREGDVVQLWTFRRAETLCLVIFKV